MNDPWGNLKGYWLRPDGRKLWLVNPPGRTARWWATTFKGWRWVQDVRGREIDS